DLAGAVRSGADEGVDPAAGGGRSGRDPHRPLRHGDRVRTPGRQTRRARRSHGGDRARRGRARRPSCAGRRGSGCALRRARAGPRHRGRRHARGGGARRRHRDQRAGPGRVARPARPPGLNTRRDWPRLAAGVPSEQDEMKRSQAGLLFLLALLPAFASGSAGGGASADALMRHVQVLASDAFEGRAPATPGEEKTVAYLVEEFRKAGVEPGGEDGGWTQSVPLVRARVEGPVKAVLRTGGRTRVLANGEDLTLQTLSPVDRVDVVDAPLVFVGFGISAPERGRDDYKGADLAGKIAVALINDPDFETAEPGAVDGRAVTYHGRWTYTHAAPARRGARGAPTAHETAPAAYGWDTVRSSGLSPLSDSPREDAAREHTLLRGWMQRALAESLFDAAGLDFGRE